MTPLATVLLVFVLAASLIGLTILAGWFCWKTLTMLMHFHNAGNAWSGVHLQTKKLEVELKQAEAEKARAETDRLKAEHRNGAPQESNRFGGSKTTIPLG